MVTPPKDAPARPPRPRGRLLTQLIAVAGVLCLVGFCAYWPPGALLVAGVGLLGLAFVRAVNRGARERSGR